ncbi:MAG: alpha-E domain-containing protein [Synergistaceae bacterium]|nr:alpha-E domain-containing protein [Synergistaceae bacterium]
MSILSRENSERLFWLGRYSERVYTGLRSIIGSYAKNFSLDETNPESAVFSLARAYDNAIVLRDEIGSETFSYIQLAVYEINKAKKSLTPLIHLQKVIDNIAAFCGMADDSIEDEHARGIIKLGKRIERVDLYSRMNANVEDIRREIRRLIYRLPKTGLRYDAETLERLIMLANDDSLKRPEIVKEVEGLIKFLE